MQKLTAFVLAAVACLLLVACAPPPQKSAAGIVLHTETWAYDDCGNGGVGASSALVDQWLTYAEANCGPGGDAKAIADCHPAACQVIQYLDTNWLYQHGSPPWPSFSAAANESWYQHNGTARVATNSYGGGLLVNQTSADTQAFFQNWVRQNHPAADGLMMDDQSPGLSMQLYPSTCGCKSTAEVPSNDALLAAHTLMSRSMTKPDGSHYVQIDNSLPPNPYLAQGFNLLSARDDVEGLVAEGEPMYNGRLDPFYSTLLDQIAFVSGYAGAFVVPLSYDSAGAATQPRSRRVQEGTILLGYSPGHLVDWADLEQGSKSLAVWPEEGLYPTQPVQSMSTPTGTGCLAGGGLTCAQGGHNDLQVAPGVYRREFAACYSHGDPVGACASIVNTTGSPVAIQPGWLTQTYGHTVGMVGGDVQSGGTLDLAQPFVAGSSVPAYDAELLVT